MAGSPTVAKRPDGGDEPPGAEGLDGRARRRVGNYEAIVDAAIEFLVEGEIRPTARQIAEKTGLSIRTVFRLIQDVGSLHAAAVLRATERILPVIEELPRAGALAERIAAFVERRAKLLEAMSPVRRFAFTLAGESDAIRDSLEQSRDFLRSQVESVFEKELEAAGSDRREGLADVLEIATSWEAWELLRRVRCREVREAEAVMKANLHAALDGLSR